MNHVTLTKAEDAAYNCWFGTFEFVKKHTCVCVMYVHLQTLHRSTRRHVYTAESQTKLYLILMLTLEFAPLCSSSIFVFFHASNLHPLVTMATQCLTSQGYNL